MTAGTPQVRLRAITGDEFAEFVKRVEAGYASDIEIHGGQTRDAALEKASADMAAALPKGMGTPGHAIFVVEADGVDVGRLWLAERTSGGRRTLFVYDVEIDGDSRGRGYGRAAMRLAEEEARTRGIDHLELNVFGGNDVARNLYRSLGYLETSVQMRKRLGSDDRT